MKALALAIFMVFAMLLFGSTATDWGYSFDIQGHRGARGLKPENSMIGFQRAIELGVTTIELDLGVTADRVVVVYHDRALIPTRVRKDGEFISEPVLIKDLTYEELQEYDVGTIKMPEVWPMQLQLNDVRIPTLKDVLLLVREHNEQSDNKVFLNVEIKASPLAPEDTVPVEEFVALVIETVRKTTMDKWVSIQSFYWTALRMAKDIAPEIPTVALVSSTNFTDSAWTDGLSLIRFGFDIARMAAEIKARVISPAETFVSTSFIERARAYGLQVIPWTINEAERMIELIKLGVDGIITDYPDVLIDVLEKLGMR